MKVSAYLVLGRGRGGIARARRVTQRRPWLDADEALVRLELELPDDVFEAPLLTVPVEAREVAVAVSVEPPLDDDESEAS